MSERDRHVDPVTGQEITGHEWNGIIELNTRVPRIVLWALAITFIYSLISWVLLPAWPLGNTATGGLLGLDQEEEAVDRYQRLREDREGWVSAFAAPDFDTVSADAGLMAKAMPAAARLYADNCAACHGADGRGGPGFPNIADQSWLWAGDPAAIAETLRVGINSSHPDTRFAQMPAFGRQDMLPRDDLMALTEHVLALGSGEASADSEAATLFAQNCASCHGEGGSGGLGNGAPSLSDDAWIYEGSHEAVWNSLQNGRQGVMPAWEDRLSAEEINLLALYVSRLSQADRAEAER